MHASSGTSGKPTVVGYTRNDIDNWAEVIARAVASAGGKKGDIFHNTYGYGLFTGGIGVHYGVEKLGAAVVPVSGEIQKDKLCLSMILNQEESLEHHRTL